MVSFDDKIDIRTVEPTFTKLDLEAKYTSMRIPLDGIPGFKLDVLAKFGEIRYPQPLETNLLHKETNNNIEIRATIGKEDAEATAIIKAYDSNIRLY